MKPVLAAITGALCALAALTLFGSEAFFAIATIYCLLLFWTFFGSDLRLPWLFLIGTSLILEMLGVGRFGLYALYGLCFYVINQLFRERLRFTSPEIRLTIALGLLLAVYDLLFAPGDHVHTVPGLTLLLILTLVGLFFRRKRRDEILYELV
jgi:hypothetical protein